MSAFGDKLRRAREQKGVSLREIADKTKISVGSLESLEKGTYSRLPGGIFSRAFVRAYAQEVGLDPDALVQEFLVEFDSQAPGPGEDSQHAEVTSDDREFLERQRRAGLWLRVVVVAIVVVIIAVVVWEVRRRGQV